MALHQAQGHTLDQALDSLQEDGFNQVYQETSAIAQHLAAQTPPQKRDPHAYIHLAGWAKGLGLRDVYGLACRKYYEVTGNYQSFGHFLIEEHRRLGQYAEMVQAIDELVARCGYGNEGDAVWALIQLGDLAAAETRLTELRNREHDRPYPWILTALLSAKQGRIDTAHVAINEAVKLGYSGGFKELNLILPLTEEQKLLGQGNENFWRVENTIGNWLRDPGAFLKPSESESPHWFGGDDFQMPDCPLCGEKMFQWFLLDIHQIQPLQEKLPNWTFFPVLGCDCSLWLHGGRIDYEVNTTTMSVKLANTTSRIKSKDKEHVYKIGYPWPIPKQYAQLEWIKVFDVPLGFPYWEIPDVDEGNEEDEMVKAVKFFWDFGWSKPQVSGYPWWTQQAEKLYCRTCREPMIYVAGMTRTEEFNFDIWINNGSGYQYHFACNHCHTISVIRQNT